MGKTIFIPNSLGGGGMGNGNLIRIPIALATTNSVTTLPIGSIVIRAYINVTVPYSVGTTISLGTPLSPSLFVAAASNDPTIANLYDFPQDTVIAAVEVLRATIAGGPLVGAGFVAVEYFIPQS